MDGDQEAAELAAVADVARRAAGGAAADKKPIKKKDAMIEANLKDKEEEKFGRDISRITQNASQGTSRQRIDSLVGCRSSVKTTRGSLRLALEVLKLAADSGDKVTAYDLLWAVEASDAFKSYERELRGAVGGGAVVEAVVGN
jgi:hypothetical protein